MVRYSLLPGLKFPSGTITGCVRCSQNTKPSSLGSHRSINCASFRLLKQMGEIVAVTGDGVNDAPALKRADIGIAMGLRWNHVAKEASHMRSSTDDNFSSIVAAIEEGRAIFDNIKRFAAYVLNSNPQEMYPYVFWVLFPGTPLAMTVMGVLAVDVGTDLIPAMGLGIEPPERGIIIFDPEAFAAVDDSHDAAALIRLRDDDFDCIRRGAEDPTDLRNTLDHVEHIHRKKTLAEKQNEAVAGGHRQCVAFGELEHRLVCAAPTNLHRTGCFTER